MLCTNQKRLFLLFVGLECIWKVNSTVFNLFPGHYLASFLVLKCEIIYITGYTIATCIQAKYCANYVTTFTNIWLMDYIRGVCKTELLYLERCYTPPYKWVMHEHTDTFVFFRHLTTAVYTLSTPNLGKRETENILQLFFVDVDIKQREVCKLHTIWMCMQNNQTSLSNIHSNAFMRLKAKQNIHNNIFNK